MAEHIRIRQWKDTKQVFIIFEDSCEEWSDAGYQGHCAMFDAESDFGHGPYRRAMWESDPVRENLPEALALVNELVTTHKYTDLVIL